MVRETLKVVVKESVVGARGGGIRASDADTLFLIRVESLRARSRRRAVFRARDVAEGKAWDGAGQEDK